MLESKSLPDGGFPAEGKYYRVEDEPAGGGSLVDWGGKPQTLMNEFVTVESLAVLSAVGRLTL